MTLLLLLFCIMGFIGLMLMAGWAFSQSAAAAALGDTLLLAFGEHKDDAPRRTDQNR